MEDDLITKTTYLAVSFDDKEELKQAKIKLDDGSYGVKYDDQQSLWYAKAGVKIKDISKWLPKINATAFKGKIENDPVREFKSTLEENGFIIDGDPIMDGTRQRVQTIDDKSGQTSGAYTGYLDNHPAGWYQNHRNNPNPVKWKATGRQRGTTDINTKAIFAQKKHDRKLVSQAKQEHHARRSQQLYDLLIPAKESNYTNAKGVKIYRGVKIDKKNRLVIPLVNVSGQVRSIQRISDNGFKSLKKGAPKRGGYFVVGDKTDIVDGDTILYAEGYSTAASIAEATNRPVIMTIDAGNMPVVAAALKDKYPNSNHIALADNDRFKKTNKGLICAKKTAEITGGSYITPSFTKEEIEKKYTDFNDLHVSRGIGEVAKQLDSVLESEAVQSAPAPPPPADINHKSIQDAPTPSYPINTDNLEQKTIEEKDRPINSNSVEGVALKQTKLKKPASIDKYYVEVDGQYYYKNKTDQLAFTDKGKRIQTKLTNKYIVRSIIDIAEFKGWTELAVKGSNTFKQMVWIEATARGLNTIGYTPTMADLAALKVLSAKVSNEVSNAKEKENTDTPNDKADLKSTLVAHGEAPYKHDPDNSASYYATLDREGVRTTLWGIGIKDAITNVGAEVGDFIHIERTGKKEVTVNAPVKENGKIVGTKPITTHRNDWVVTTEKTLEQAHAIKTKSPEELVESHPELVNEIAVVEIAKKYSSEKLPEKYQRPFVEKVKTRVAKKVSEGKGVGEIHISQRQVVQEADQEELER
jgi:putative DNA primase/helicase